MPLWNIALIIHLTGLILGLGSTTVADLSLVRILRRRVIHEEDYLNLKFLSHLVWLGWGVLLASGLWLVALNGWVPADKHLAKLVITLVIGANGLYLHRVVFPKILEAINHDLVTTSFWKTLGASVTSGAISVTSWWVVFVMGALRQLSFTTGELLLGYVVVLLGAILIGQLITFRLQHGPNRLHARKIS